MSFQNLLKSTSSYALNYLDSLDSKPVQATIDIEALRENLGVYQPLATNGLDPETVIDELIKSVDGGILGTAGGRFYGWVVGGTLPAALAADWLTSTWDQPAALYASSPAVSVIEEVSGSWLKQSLNIPDQASFAFVSGCSMAHMTCLAAARHALLSRLNWDVELKGLFGAPPIRVISNDQRHGSIARTLRLLGMGNGCVEEIPVNANRYMDPQALEKTLAESPHQPTIVILQAGDINTGVFDPFEQLIPIAHKYGAWVHIDGAFGLWVATSPKFRHLLKGVQDADSWAVDGHKWLNVPYDSGYAFITDDKSHKAAMSHRASYLTHAAEARDQMDWTPVWSHRGRAITTWAALRQLGKQGLADLIERTCKFAERLTIEIGNLPRAELVWAPIINQGLVRFLSPKPNATEEDNDAYTNDVISRINHSGEAFFSGTTMSNRRCMRISVCNWNTSENDINRVIEAVTSVLAESAS